MTKRFLSFSTVCTRIEENNAWVAENLRSINERFDQNNVDLQYDCVWIENSLGNSLPIKTSSGYPVLPINTKVWPLKLSTQINKEPYLFSNMSVGLKRDVELQNSFALPTFYFIDAVVMFATAVLVGQTIEQFKASPHEVLEPVVKKILEIQKILHPLIKPFTRFSENMYKGGNHPSSGLHKHALIIFPRPQLYYQMTFFEKPVATQNPFETIVGFVFKLPKQ